MVVEFACVTGRFQPVHIQHLELFKMALDKHPRLVIGITNPDSMSREFEPLADHRHDSTANPFTYFERMLAIRAAVEFAGFGRRVLIVPFDLNRPEVWIEYLPDDCLHYVRAYSAWEREKARRLSDAGYLVEVVEGDLAKKIESSGIRCKIRANGEWMTDVPPGAAALVAEFLVARSMDER